MHRIIDNFFENAQVIIILSDIWEWSYTSEIRQICYKMICWKMITAMPGSVAAKACRNARKKLNKWPHSYRHTDAQHCTCRHRKGTLIDPRASTSDTRAFCSYTHILIQEKDSESKGRNATRYNVDSWNNAVVCNTTLTRGFCNFQQCPDWVKYHKQNFNLQISNLRASGTPKS